MHSKAEAGRGECGIGGGGESDRGHKRMSGPLS